MKLVKGQLKLLLAAFVGALFFVGLLPANALAADTRQGQSVTVGPNEVINDDLYVAASTIDIQGTINGSLIAVGSSITVSGVVTRDVNAAAANISIPGEVQGSARLAGSQINVSGRIDGDLVVTSSTLDLAAGGTVGRDALVASATATFGGSIARDVRVTGSDVVLSGPVGGTVTAWDTTLKLTSGAAIKGGLTYTSNQNAVMEGGAQVNGPTQHAYPVNGPTFGSFVIGWVQTLIGFVLLGLLVIFLAPRFNARAVDAYRHAPWSRLGIGLAVLVVVPVVALFTFVAGLIVGGWWLAVFLFGAYLLAAAAGFMLVGEILGRFLFERIGRMQIHPILALLGGLVVLLVLTSLPWIGWLIGALAVIYGTGIAVMALPWDRRPSTPSPASLGASAPGFVRPSPSAG